MIWFSRNLVRELQNEKASLKRTLDHTSEVRDTLMLRLQAAIKNEDRERALKLLYAQQLKQLQDKVDKMSCCCSGCTKHNADLGLNTEDSGALHGQDLS